MPTSFQGNTDYFDGSSNTITTFSLLDPDPNTHHIHMNANPLRKLDVSNFTNLLTLSLDYCGISSFSVISNLKSLLSLSLIGNNISNFEHLPIMPKLTTINLTLNDVEFDPIITAVATGSNQITKVNGIQLTKKQFSNIVQFSPIVGIALRNGRNPDPVEDELNSSLQFLSSDPPLTEVNSNGSSIIRCPITSASHYQWFILIGEEWKLIPECNTSTLPVTSQMDLHLIKCEYDGHVSYTPDVINRPKKTAITLYNDQPTIEIRPTLLLLSHSVSYPYHVSWFIDDDPVGTDSFCLELPPGSGGKRIRAEVEPFSLAFPSIAFAPQSATAIVPIEDVELLDFKIPDDPMEDEPFEITFKTYPESSRLLFTIEKAKEIDDDFSLVTALKLGKTQFTPTPDETGCFLRASCQIGNHVFYAYSEHRVTKAAPKIKAVISGVGAVLHPHLAVYSFADNGDYPVTISWFVIDPKGGEKTVIGNGQICTPPAKYEGFSFGADFTPDIGNATTTIVFSDSLSPENKQIDNHPEYDEPIQDYRITMPKAGKWYVSEPELKEVSTGDSYIPSKKDIGKFIAFRNDSVDVILGQVKPTNSPIRDVDLQVESATVGATLYCNVAFYPGEDCDYNIEWIRSRDGEEVVVQNEGSDYLISFDDLGAKIKVSVSANGTKKESIFTSEIVTGPVEEPLLQRPLEVGETIVIPERCQARWFIEDEQESWVEVGRGRSHKLTFFDAGHRLRVNLLSKGIKYQETSKDQVMTISVFEGDTINIDQVFHLPQNDDQRVCVWFWYDFKTKKWEKTGSGSSYTIQQKDIDHVIRAVCYTKMEDGSKSDEIFADISDIHGIESAPQRVKIEVAEDGTLWICGSFHGVSDDQIAFFWRQWHDDGSRPIDATERQLTPTLAMIGDHVDGGFQFLKDGQPISKIYWSENRIPIDRALPSPEAELTEKRLAPGEVLTVTVQKVKNCTPVYQWSLWDGTAFKPMPECTSNEYVITEKDYNCYVCCDVLFQDRTGLRGPITSLETSTTINEPSFIEIEGVPRVGEVLIARCVGPIAESKQITWETSDNVQISRHRKLRVVEELAGYTIRVIGYIDGEVVKSQPVTIETPAKQPVNAIKFTGREGNGRRWIIEANPKHVDFKTKGISHSINWNALSFGAHQQNQSKVWFRSRDVIDIAVTPIVNAGGKDPTQIRDMILDALNSIRDQSRKTKTLK